jgi:hypothetical protein
MLTSSPKKGGGVLETQSMMSGVDQEKKVKELEKKITKLRNEK